MVLYILEKKQRHIFWFLSFSVRTVIKPGDREKKDRLHLELCCFNKLVHQKSTPSMILPKILLSILVLHVISPTRSRYSRRLTKGPCSSRSRRLLRHWFTNRWKCHLLQSNRHGFRNRLKCHLLQSIISSLNYSKCDRLSLSLVGVNETPVMVKP